MFVKIPSLVGVLSLATAVTAHQTVSSLIRLPSAVINPASDSRVICFLDVSLTRKLGVF